LLETPSAHGARGWDGFDANVIVGMPSVPGGGIMVAWRCAVQRAAAGAETGRASAAATLNGMTGAGEGISGAQAEALYAAIRRMRGDISRVAQATGAPEDVVRSVRQHLFLDTHEIAVGPNQTVSMRFTADPEIAELWTRAAGRGVPLAADEVAVLRCVIGHEYVERALMRHGEYPYRSADPRAWVQEDGVWVYRPTPEAFGAHDLAPRPGFPDDPYGHYPTVLGIGKSP